MIKSFRCKDTRQLFDDLSVRRFHSVQRASRRKLLMIHRAKELGDLRVPPGNHLEALKGDRAGFHSIRINDQWRVCFRWVEGDTFDVEIVDYHK